jgi:hypothetical protein
MIGGEQPCSAMFSRSSWTRHRFSRKKNPPTRPVSFLISQLLSEDIWTRLTFWEYDHLAHHEDDDLSVYYRVFLHSNSHIFALLCVMWVFDASLTGYLAKQPVSSAAGFKTPTCKTLAGFYNPPPPPRGPPWPPGAPRGWGCDGRDM